MKLTFEKEKLSYQYQKGLKGKKKELALDILGNTPLHETSKFVDIKIDEPIVEALIEVLQSFLKDDSIDTRKEELIIERSSNGTVVNVE